MAFFFKGGGEGVTVFSFKSETPERSNEALSKVLNLYN